MLQCTDEFGTQDRLCLALDSQLRSKANLKDTISATYSANACGLRLLQLGGESQGRNLGETSTQGNPP